VQPASTSAKAEQRWIVRAAGRTLAMGPEAGDLGQKIRQPLLNTGEKSRSEAP
jgi:hypothetical protein